MNSSQEQRSKLNVARRNTVHVSVRLQSRSALSNTDMQRLFRIEARSKSRERFPESTAQLLIRATRIKKGKRRNRRDQIVQISPDTSQVHNIFPLLARIRLVVKAQVNEMRLDAVGKDRNLAHLSLVQTLVD